MRIDDFIKLFPILADVRDYEGNLSPLAVELISRPGRGKSETAEYLRDMMSEREGQPWGMSTLMLATQTPPDLIGFQFKGELTYEGKTITITDPTAPTWFICDDGKPVFAYKRGIMFLDEYGQGQTDVKAASADLLLNKRLGKWKLPDGWIVLAASNRMSDRSAVTKSLDFTINRRLEFHIDDDIEGWSRWADRKKLLEETRAFAVANPTIVMSDAPDQQGPWCTPRSLAMADRLIQSFMRANGGQLVLNDSLLYSTIAGMIGAPAASQWMATANLRATMPKYDDILADPENVPVPTRPDAQMLIAFHLAAHLKVNDSEHIITYVRRMATDFSLTFMREAIKKSPALIAHPAVQKWCAQNSSIMAAISVMK